MRKLVCVFLLFISYNTLLAQHAYFPKYEKEDLIPLIKDTTDYAVIEDIIYYELKEAVPYLETYFSKQKNKYVKNRFLTALLYLGSEKTQQFALEYFDSVNAIQDQKYYTDELIDIAYVLFETKDYSRADEIVQLVDTMTIVGGVTYLSMLSSLIQSNKYTNWAKLKLKSQVLDYNSKNTTRNLALSYYVLNFGKESIPLIKEVLQTDPDENYRSVAFDELLELDNGKETQQFILELIPSENDVLKYRFSSDVLEKCSTPNVYKTLSDYDEQNIIDFSNNLWAFFPSVDTSSTIFTILDTLISYTNQCFEYEWINNRGIYNSLTKKLENAKKDLAKGNEKPAKSKIEAFQNEVAAQNEKHITAEGYKFLYYYSGYLIERL